MYLPQWLYEAKPLAYGACALGALAATRLQPIGMWSSALLFTATACICFMRYRFRSQHRGRYW